MMSLRVNRGISERLFTQCRVFACLAVALPWNATAHTPEKLQVVFGPAGCFSTGSHVMGLTSSLREVARELPDVAVENLPLGPYGLRQSDRLLVPAPDARDPWRATRALLAAPERYTQTVLVQDLPVLNSPNETTWFYPLQSVSLAQGLLRVSSNTANTAVQPVRLSVFRAPDADAVWLVETAPERERPLGPVTDWTVQTNQRIRVRGGTHTSTLTSLSTTHLRGSRVLAEIDTRRARYPEATVMVGKGVLGMTAFEDLCLKTSQRVGYDAVAPMFRELRRGPQGVVDLMRSHGLPFVAANVEASDEEARAMHGRVFPRYRIVRRQGLSVVVTALRSPASFDSYPEFVRRQWHIRPPTEALSKALAAAKAELRGPPDLTVLLWIGPARPAPANGGTEADLVIGPATGDDHRTKRVRSSLAPGGLRETSRSQPLLDAEFGLSTLNDVVVSFGEDHRAKALVHTSTPVFYEGPRDDTLEQALRLREEKMWPRWSEVLLPDPTPLLAQDPYLHGLVFGPTVLYFNAWTERTPNDSVEYTQQLWMRVVARGLQQTLGADVGVSGFMPQTSNNAGALSRDLMLSYLRQEHQAVLVEVKGSFLRWLSTRIQQQREALPPPEALLETVGLNVDSVLVAGRAVEDDTVYRVAMQGRVLEALQKNAEELDEAVVHTKFDETSTGFVPGAQGTPLPLEQMMEWWLGQHRAPAEPVGMSTLQRMLADRSKVRTPLWVFRVDTLSLTAQQQANSRNPGPAVELGESRVASQDNLALETNLDASVSYDGPVLAWETRVKAEFGQTRNEAAPARDLPRTTIEQADDLLVTTELRLNAVEVPLVRLRAGIVPFVQAAFDTEFTPGVPGTDVRSRQALARAQLGATSVPARVFRLVRLGALYEYDVQKRRQGQLGVAAGYELALDLLPSLRWESSADARYLLPNDRDTASDLGLRAQFINKLAVPIASGLSIFGVADVLLVRGKVPSNNDVVANWRLGGGLEFSGAVQVRP